MMQRALELAEKGAGLVSPGAMVGTVIVKDGKTVGEGFYTWEGKRHAEIIALEEAGSNARGATVYVSLEPCSHHGRTPPCAKALIDAGVEKVVAAMQDPDPRVNGRGLEMLRASGIRVECGVMENEARRLNEAFVTYKSLGRPFGILKIAMTLDGRIATRSGESRWITSEQSRQIVQRLRHRCDAIVTGSGTILADKPQLTDRTGLPRRRPLLRIVLDRRGRISEYDDALLFRGSLTELAAELYRREIQSYILECGPDLAFSALEAGIIDKMVIFVAPRILGASGIPAIGGGVEHLAEAFSLVDWTVTPTGPDVMFTGYVHRNR
jgi:diaminohydroxyphosphoribosylaminopyrimidine deaminase/5-amino-6-(5-phosphoribosylamino)uracil reductase